MESLSIDSRINPAAEPASPGNVIAVGKCNKCGLRKQLDYRGSVCGACSAALDAEWGYSNATDWILITTSVTEQQRRVGEILWGLKVCIAQAKGQPQPEFAGAPKRATLHIFRNTEYAGMKTHWAAGKLPDGLGFGYP